MMRLVGLLAPGLAFSLALLAAPAGAFVTLDGAPRWDHDGSSLRDHEERTLGGGIEFAVAKDFCERLLPRFRDQAGLTCHHLRGAVGAAMARWSRDHPALGFVDISDTSWQVDLRNGTGTELDLLALNATELGALQDYGAWTLVYYAPEPPFGTHGKERGSFRLRSADIVLDAGPEACYFYRASEAKEGCNHFPSLVLHELGHALGLDHPEDKRFENLGFPPGSGRTGIDCTEPGTDLTAVRLVRDVVMRGGHRDGLPVRFELAPDDLLGRDFLYPPCGASPRAPPPDGTVSVRAGETDLSLPVAPGTGKAPAAGTLGLLVLGYAALRRRAR